MNGKQCLAALCLLLSFSAGCFAAGLTERSCSMLDQSSAGLTLRIESAALTASQPDCLEPSLSQWVLVPDGCRPELHLSNQAPQGNLPAAEITRLAQMRQYTLAQVTVYPSRLPDNCDELDARVNFVADPSQRSHTTRVPSPQVQRLIEALVVNPPAHRDDAELIRLRGFYEYYLFVLPQRIDGEEEDAILAMVYRLMEWKRRAGNKVELFRIPRGDERDTAAVQPLIQERYLQLLNAGEEPFDNIVLIGEDELVPGNQGGQGMDIIIVGAPGRLEAPTWGGHYDLKYAYLEGGEDDLIADAALSRFHTGNAAMLANAVNKTLSYEATPFMEDTTWFCEAIVEEEALVNADRTVAYTVDALINTLRHNQIDVTGTFRGDTLNSARWMGEQFATGINLALGRAQNSGLTYHGGVQAGKLFQAVNVFPVTIMSSGHGEWAMESLFWVGREYYDGHPERYNDASGAKGSVVSTGMWAIPETTPNNIAAMGMAHGMLDLGLSFGWARQWMLLYLAKVYPDQPDRFEQYSDDFALCGDPGLVAWEKTPRLINVEFPPVLNQGASRISTLVTDAETDLPVREAVVTLRIGSQENEEMFRLGVTDATGRCEFAIDPMYSGEIQISAVKSGRYPFQDVITRSEESQVGLWIGSIDDQETGNGDGHFNPGETVRISFYVFDMTQNGIQSLIATATSLSEYLTLSDEEISFEHIEGADWESATITATLELSCPHAAPQHFVLNMTDGEHNWEGGLAVNPAGWRLDPESPDLRVNLDAQQLNVELLNSGWLASPACRARLETECWALNILEDTRQLASIASGEAGSTQSHFIISISNAAIRGMVAPVALVLEVDDEEFARVNFTAKLGEAAAGEPTGPDKYGYWAFDNTDRGYEPTPTYDWFEISTTEDCIIPGDTLTLQKGDVVTGWGVLDLPFPLRFYGQTFHSITVSTKGFIAMGEDSTIVPNSQNWPLDDGGMGAAYGIIAPFWDNLSRRAQNSNIFWAYSPEDDFFVIEWYNVIFPATQIRLDFQVILYNTATYPTATGDANILFQYKTIQQYGQVMSEDTPFATVGLASPDGTSGFTYSYANRYPDAVTSAPLANQRAILFTTTPREMRGRLLGVVRNTHTEEVIAGARVITPNGEAVSDRNGQWVIENVFAGVAFPVGVVKEGYYQAEEPRVIVPEDGERMVILYLTEGMSTPKDETPIPTEFGLECVYPNPFNPTATVRFSLDQAQPVKLAVFDLSGHEVARLHEGLTRVGVHEIVWNAADQPSGVYLVRLSAEGRTATVKAVLVK